MPAAPDPASAGPCISGYDIDSELGSGASRRVFLARHAQTDRLVAIKVLHPHLMHEGTALSRFRQESRAAGQLNHPHIVTLLTAGITDAQEPYLVFQYCPGPTLRELLIRSGTLDEKLFLTIFTQLADALAAAHRIGIFHRDIKPSNILLDQSLSQAKSGRGSLARPSTRPSRARPMNRYCTCPAP